MISPEIFMDIQREESHRIDSIIGLIDKGEYRRAMDELKDMSYVKRFRSEELLSRMVV